MNKLQVNFAGLRLKNPIIAASAGTTKDALLCEKAEKAGVSAVILKSVQEELINRNNPFPRMAVLRNGIAGYNSVSFMSYEQAYEGDITDYCEEIKKTKDKIKIPVIASLNCANESTWAEYAEAVERAGADAIEIVPSCPVGLFARESIEFYPIAREALKHVKKHVKIPVGLKMTQQITNPIVCALNLEKDGADWLTMFNRSQGLQIDIEEMDPIMPMGFFGHGGPWVTNSVMRWIAGTYPNCGIPISATGGVTNYEDVVRYLLSGANSVQVASLIYMKGYEVIPKIIDQLEEYAEKHHVENLEDIIGTAAKKIMPLNKIDRSIHYYAEIQPEKCIKCNKCLPVCIYGAISSKEGRPVIDGNKCDGCGLCSQVCNRAIILKKR